jgi:DNA-directed RNA polymerase subunit K/omega
MQSVECKIERLIKTRPKGVLLFPDNFADRGSADSVRKALQSLKDKGFIKSVAHGIYVRPKKKPYIGEVLPSAEEVAQAIAKRDKIRLVPTGVYSLFALGLSTQVPLKLVFLTDGAPRTVKVGKRTIKLKKTTPKNLMAKGRISSLVIQALREIGKDKAKPDELKQIRKLLIEEDHQLLKHDIKLAPEWIKQIMKGTLDGEISSNPH